MIDPATADKIRAKHARCNPRRCDALKALALADYWRQALEYL